MYDTEFSGTAIALMLRQRDSGCIRQLSGITIKKARSNDLANLLTLGVRANTVSVRLAGLENEYWPLNQTSTLSVLLVGVLIPSLGIADKVLLELC